MACCHDLRGFLNNKPTETKANFLLLNDIENLRHVVENHFIYVAKFVVDAVQRRKSVLYHWNRTFTSSIIYYMYMHIFKEFESEGKMHMQNHVW